MLGAHDLSVRHPPAQTAANSSSNTVSLCTAHPELAESVALNPAATIQTVETTARPLPEGHPSNTFLAGT